MERIFKYYPEDFGKLSVKVLHMDLDFDVYNDKTVVVSKFKAKALEEIKKLDMNAKNLEILSVDSKNKIEWTYNKKDNKLNILFSEPVKKNDEFIITTKTICKPTKNVLEGLYFDETPEGAPPTQITQCQQWGFQRIVPCIDDMTAKCTYRTSITADSRYTNLITNGDVIEERKSIGEGRDKITYSNEITPMAPYLFFLGVGTYETFKREFEYPDGTKFMLELLAPVNSDPEVAKKTLEVLFNSIMWIHVFTGPSKYKDVDKRKEIMKLVDEREKQKDKEEIRAKLKELSTIQMGYKYTGTVYREIGMQNSDFGGMENVGNTTITANRLMPYKHMTDRAFEYLTRVKVHEFYHNINGSEVTGWSPFEIWLNEAVTVHIEREYHTYLFGKDYSRLDEIQYLLAPNGVFMQDEGAMSMPIEPDGFNDPNELISHITYVKAPEFVRMIETLMGKEKFVEGLNLYHTKYKHSNATRNQWIECMEEVSGLNFSDMAQGWLKKIHFPKVKAISSYNESDMTFSLNLEQLNDNWGFPFSFALFDEKGKKIKEVSERIDAVSKKIIVSNVEKPAFVSLNRGYSFYGKVYYDDEDLFLKVKNDDDIVNRYMAYYTLMDKEKLKLLKDSSLNVDSKIIDLYFNLLSDDKLMMNAGAQFLALFESVEDESFAHYYKELYEVKKKILKSIASKYESEIKEIYEKYSEVVDTKNYLQDMSVNIKRRQVKNVCLGLLSTLDTEEIHKIIKNQFDNSDNITDEISAFSLYLESSASDKLNVLEAYEKVAKKNLVHWEIFLMGVARNNSDDALDIIKKLETSVDFRIEQTNDQRMYMVFASNKKKSLQTEEGRDFLNESILKLAKINEYSTLQLLEVFGHVDMMQEEYHVPLIKILVNVLDKTDKEKYPSVYNTAKRILSKLPKSVSSYEKEFGKIN